MAFEDFKNAQIKIIAMPDRADAQGFVKAGFIMQILDLCAGVLVKELTGKRSVTVSMDEICFKKPILVGDYIFALGRITALGASSIEISLQIALKRLCDEGFVFIDEVCSAKAVFISLDKSGKKIILDEDMRENAGV